MDEHALEAETTELAHPPPGEVAEGQWRPLTEIQRRVAGVLIEKAKTTPDQYPLTLNALTTGSNQKSNRSPQLNLDPEDVQAAVDELRSMGAAAELQSGAGRVAKYKHRLYEWLGVDKVELAVLAELLLRGAQTVGELRGRAARMEPIPDLAALRPVLESLRNKRLLVELSPPGRGQVVTHGLHETAELEQLRGEQLRDEQLGGEQGSRAGGHAAGSLSGSDAADLSSRARLETLENQLNHLSERVERLESLVGDRQT